MAWKKDLERWVDARLGLDESARSMIQTWRFEPATKNGQPVAVEVAFNLD